MKVGRVLLLFLILMGSVILFGSRGVLDNRRLDQKLSDLRKSNEELSVKNDALKKEILLLRNDMRYIEKVARDELGMVKSNDRVYRRVE
ncbi:MAG: septum formation initiator family protein [Syntrophales bacterium]|nr:septum formation initiator family protein [Syntrophales bacterium]